MEVVILAAGRGIRMGQDGSFHISHTPKPCLLLDGEAVIQRQVRLLKEAEIDNIKIVAGDNREDIQRLLDNSVEYLETSTNHKNALYEFADVCRLTKEKNVMLVLLGDTVFSKDALTEMVTTDEFGVIVYGSGSGRDLLRQLRTVWWNRGGEVFAVKLTHGWIDIGHSVFSVMPDRYYELKNISPQLKIPIHVIKECCDIDLPWDYEHALRMVRGLKPLLQIRYKTKGSV
jgi:choline kinase